MDDGDQSGRLSVKNAAVSALSARIGHLGDVPLPAPGALDAAGANGTINAEEGCRLGRSRDLCSALLRAV
jgi:hypothetical protein